MTPRILARATGRIMLPLTEKRRTRRGEDGGEKS